ncbi:hypothetical protein P6U16_28230 (plasmid) [Rhizobium sp. 32-5/1]|uniref:hypothetical protein n=1 Tax=Rhizobium sp. 32-5/1 TaxID=3019602 RepID=UPI00240D8080|nr:hypothetical protein [Rhizobium sp. 32-5/1]WEZ86221.1 hypothetical protein P6U16_28230 [Rhizobium sp. 32-5/1]
MRLFNIIIATLAISFLPAGANAQSSRQQFAVPTDSGGVLVESFRSCANATCPAVVILSGSKGLGAPVYDEIGQTLRAAGLNAYLVHVLSAADLDAIAAAGSARARIAYYAKRLPDWISAVQGVAAHLEGQPRHGGKVGVLGISLARKSLRPLRSGEPILTPWSWSMVVSRTAIRSLSARCRPYI